jgi:hypothetical protein
MMAKREKSVYIVAETLRKILEEKGIMEFVLADHLGLTKSGLSRKMNGDRPWKHSEILATVKFLEYQPGDETKVFPEMFPPKETGTEI